MTAPTHPSGLYHYAPGIYPYSGGARASDGREIEHVTIMGEPDWRDGFAAIDRYLAEREVPRTALCGVELRCPRPHSFDGFIAFNEEYRRLLEEWGLLDGEENPVARTNVAPVEGAPTQTTLAGFCVSVPSERTEATFVVAGAGDLVDQSDLRPEAIVGAADPSGPAWATRVHQVLDEMEARMSTLGVTWAQVTDVDVYCASPGWTEALGELAARLGDTTARGLHWFVAHPPISGLTFEMDLRGVRTERRLHV